jgi:hypothetical protein
MLRTFSFHWSWAVLIAAVVAAPLVAQIAAPRAGAAPASAGPLRLVVLRNGEVLKGAVAPEGERFVITLPGRQISLRDSEIDVVADTLEEAYRLKRNKTRPTDVDGRLDLAAWCIHHRLWANAQAELAAAANVQPYNLRLAVLQHRLQRSIAHATAQSETAKDPPRSRGTVAEKSPVVQAVARGPDRQANDAGRAWPPAASSRSIAATKSADSLSNKDPQDRPAAAESPASLERFVRSLPARAVEQFTNSLHPMIVRSCATAGCHAPGNRTEFTLLRLPHGRAPSRRLTQRNLYSTAQLVDFSNSSESRLLAIASQPHGPLKAGAFGDARSPRYQELVDWINTLTGKTADGGDESLVDQATATVDWERARQAIERTAPLAQPADPSLAADELQPNQPAEVRTGVSKVK